MPLILRAVSYKSLPPTIDISAQFNEQGGSIGRSPDNHLVLPDPEKFISRHHASIIFQAGQYFIEDSSSGGTYLNLKNQLLQKSQSVLENGERLRIGEYELAVTITAVNRPEIPQSTQPVRQLELAESGLLDDPFGSSIKPADPNNFYSSFIEQPESSVFHESFTPPQVATAPVSNDDDALDFGDLLSSLDALPGASVNKAPEMPELPDDFFADDIAPIANPEPVLPSAEFDSLFIDKAAAMAPEEPVDVLVEPKSIADVDLDPFAAVVMPTQLVEEKPLDFAIPNPAFNPVKSASVNEIKTDTLPQAVSIENQPQQVRPVIVESELMKHFLAGVGIDDINFLPEEQWPALMKTSGEILRSMVEGLMLVLRARAELKSQFRVSVTTMRSIDNNPLKFTPNTNDALKLILAPTNPGFLAPKTAVSEGFSDIMNHQMAMTAGIQAALADVLRSFDPQIIEKTQGEGVLFQKKAKCWEYYVEKYPQLKAAAQEEFFSDAFAEAYEKQMQLLSRASKS